MSGEKTSRPSRAAKSAARAGAPLPNAQRPEALFGLAGIHTRHLVFNEVPRPPTAPDDTGERKMDANISIVYGIREPAGDRAEVRVRGKVRPDPRDKPYEIEVELVAQFVLKQGDRTDLEQFCKLQAPTIMFPYLREVVSRITMSARFGPVHLDPVNLSQVVDQTAWRSSSSPAVE